MIAQWIAAHHGETSDPALLEWLTHRLDGLLGLGPVAAVALLLGVIALMPLVTLALYVLYNRSRQS